MQLYNINNFEQGTVVKLINSPRSLEACLRSGLDPSDLLPVPREQFIAPNLTDKMIDIKVEVNERKRQENIKLVQHERDAIIAYAERKNRNPTSPTGNGNTSSNTTNKPAALVEIEEKRMEALRQRQKQEMDKLIEKEKAIVVLQQKIAHAEQEEAKKKKIHEKKVAEQKAQAAKKAQQIQEEIANKEREEAELRKALDRKEQALTKKLNKERAENEKRILQEARERDIERAQKVEAHRKQTEALLDAQFKIAEDNREKMLERERRVQEQLEKKKQDKAEEIAKLRNEATERMEKALHKHEETQEKKKKDFHDNEMAALERAKLHEKEKMELLKRQASDREKRNQLRFQRLVDAYKNRKEKRENIIQRRNEKDSIFGKLQEERDAHIAMLKFTTDLKMEDKQENVERVARVNEFRRLQLLRKIESEDNRWLQIKTEKKKLSIKHLDEVKSTLTRKHEVANAMEIMRITNDFSLLDTLFASKKKKGKTIEFEDDKHGHERLAHTA